MDFSTVSADGAEKSKNQCFFDQKSTLTKIARKFGKSNPNPFQRRRNHEKIFINGREIAILVHFWGCSRRSVDFGKATFTKNRRKNQGFSYISRRGAHESGSNLRRGRAPKWGACRNGLGAVGRGHVPVLGRFGAKFRCGDGLLGG